LDETRALVNNATTVVPLGPTAAVVLPGMLEADWAASSTSPA
jgi:hypothetical protein